MLFSGPNMGKSPYSQVYVCVCVVHVCAVTNAHTCINDDHECCTCTSKVLSKEALHCLLKVH